MVESLVQSIGSVFSILRPEQAKEASREVLARYLNSAPELTLTWVDLDQAGGFLRAGITYTADLSTRFLARDADDPMLCALLDGVGSEDVRAGRIVYAAGSDTFLWYLPYRRSPNGLNTLVHYKGLAVGAALFDEVVTMFNAACGITPAERRTLFQIVVGATPRAAAAADGVSFHTKRAQIKSLCDKLECRSQIELVRMMLGQLVHLVHVSDGDTARAQTIEAFTNRHLPSSVRLIVRPVGEGRQLRTFECGPADGEPVLHIHGMLYPLLLINGAAICERLGIRLITPVRSGYLDDQSGAALFGEDDCARDGIDLARFIDQHFGRPLPIVAHSIGAGPALHFVRQHPRHVSGLTLLSPHFAGDRHRAQPFQPFLSGLKALIDRPGLFRYLAWQFRKYYVDDKTVRRVLRNMFSASASDLAVLEDNSGSGSVYEWFADGYRTSVVGIAEDMALSMGDTQTELAALTVQTRVVFGPDDPISAFVRGELDPARLPHVTAVPLPAGGHLVAASHPEAVWTAIAAGLDTRPEDTAGAAARQLGGAMTRLAAFGLGPN